MPNQRARFSTCLSKQGTTQIQSRDLSMPLPLGVILLAININQKLITWIQSCDLSTQLPVGAILLAININRKLATINAKSKGTILNLFIKGSVREK